jgi:AcrR family transcriptional regulator
MTRKEPKDKRVSDILDSAISEFLENGYEKTSMEAIAKRAKLTKGGLYHHFRSKDEILLAANRILFEPIEELMVESAGFERAAEGLRHFIKQYIRYHVEHPQNAIFFFLSMTKVMATPELSVMYRDYTVQYTAFFTELFAKAVTQGDFKSQDSKARALAYESALDGVLWYLSVNKDISYEETVKGFEEVFINSLLIPDDRSNEDDL